ncbi:MAG: glycosyltransferase family 2 protein [Acidimicrobiia bacterium]|nr:glycosyltransferase family 2 protein [Acidimicrobiia bacterium]
MTPVYSIVIPVLDEEQVLPSLFGRLADLMSRLDGSAEVVLVDDGSTDASFELIQKHIEDDPRFRGLRLSRNFGHQIAITAGMDAAKGDAVVVMDADLQDPPEVVLEMVERWKQGFVVVAGRRVNREGESAAKRWSAHAFYRLLHRLSDTDIPVDVGDFRLLDRRAVDALKSMPERHRYVRGLVAWLGYPQTTVDYTRPEREQGETKYTLSRMIGLAVNGIVGFSSVPLRLISKVGVAVSAVSFLAGIGSILAFFLGATVPGWTSTVVVAFFVGGVQLVVLGVIGEYVGRIYDEVRQRPLYLVSEVAGSTGE